MQYERDAVAGAEESHCYFPEWADRPVVVGVLLEADHNSYLAGGYSEEFGYALRPDRPPVFPPLEGDPEGDGLWCVQIGGLHPGYPECPYPHDRDRIDSGDGSARSGKGAVRSGKGGRASRLDVVAVGTSGRDAARGASLSRRLATAWMRVQMFGASLHSAVGGVAVMIDATPIARPGSRQSPPHGSRTPTRDEEAS